MPPHKHSPPPPPSCDFPPQAAASLSAVAPADDLPSSSDGDEDLPPWLHTGDDDAATSTMAQGWMERYVDGHPDPDPDPDPSRPSRPTSTRTSSRPPSAHAPTPSAAAAAPATSMPADRPRMAAAAPDYIGQLLVGELGQPEQDQLDVAGSRWARVVTAAAEMGALATRALREAEEAEGGAGWQHQPPPPGPPQSAPRMSPEPLPRARVQAALVPVPPPAAATNAATATPSAAAAATAAVAQPAAAATTTATSPAAAAAAAIAVPPASDSGRSSSSYNHSSSVHQAALPPLATAATTTTATPTPVATTTTATPVLAGTLPPQSVVTSLVLTGPALAEPGPRLATFATADSKRGSSYQQSRLAGSSRGPSPVGEEPLPPPRQRMRREAPTVEVASLPTFSAPTDLPPARPPSTVGSSRGPPDLPPAVMVGPSSSPMQILPLRPPSTVGSSRGPPLRPAPPPSSDPVTLKAPSSLPEVKVTKVAPRPPAAPRPPPLPLRTLGPLVQSHHLMPLPPLQPPTVTASMPALPHAHSPEPRDSAGARTVRFSSNVSASAPSLPLLNACMMASSGRSSGDHPTTSMSYLHTERSSDFGAEGGAQRPNTVGMPYIDSTQPAPRARQRPANFSSLDELCAEYDPFQGRNSRGGGGNAWGVIEETAEELEGPPAPPLEPALKGEPEPVPPQSRTGAQTDRPLRMAGTTAVWYENMQQILHPGSFSPVAYESARRKDMKRPGGNDVGAVSREGGAEAGSLGSSAVGQVVRRLMLPFKPRVEGSPSEEGSGPLQGGWGESNMDLLRRAAEGPMQHTGGAGVLHMSMPGTAGYSQRGKPPARKQVDPRSSMPGSGLLLPHLADQEALSAQHVGMLVPFAWQGEPAQPSAALLSAEKRQQQVQQQLGRSTAGAGSSGGGFLAFLGLGGQGGRQGRRQGSSGLDVAAALEAERARKQKRPRPGSVHPAQAAWSEAQGGGSSSSSEHAGDGRSR